MAKEEITSKVKCLEMSENKKKKILKLVRCSKSRLQMKFIAATSCVKKKEKFQINEKPEDEKTKPIGRKKK